MINRINLVYSVIIKFCQIKTVCVCVRMHGFVRLIVETAWKSTNKHLMCILCVVMILIQKAAAAANFQIFQMIVLSNMYTKFTLNLFSATHSKRTRTRSQTTLLAWGRLWITFKQRGTVWCVNVNRLHRCVVFWWILIYIRWIRNWCNTFGGWYVSMVFVWCLIKIARISKVPCMRRTSATTKRK